MGHARKALPWISYGAGMVGGSALMMTWAGGILGTLVGLVPALANILVILGLVAMGIDIAVDQTPNRLAMWVAILVPSLALGMGGKVGQHVNDFATSIANEMSQRTSDWFGTGAMWVLASLGISIALLVQRRAGGGGGGRGRGRGAALAASRAGH